MINKKQNKIFFVVVFFILSVLVISITNIIIKNEITLDRKNIYNNLYKNQVNNLEVFIKTKKHITNIIALTLSNDNSIKDALLYNQPKNLNLDQIAKKISVHNLYKNVWFQIIDNRGISFYRSWSNKRGDNIINFRKDLQELYINPKISSAVSIGKFDLTLKSFIPIYDYDRNFLGIFEMITHFNSITEKLKQQHIDSIILVDDSYFKQLKFPFTKKFIDKFYVANLNVQDNLLNLIKEKSVESFLKIDKYITTDEYYISKYQLKDINDKNIASFFMFVKLKNIDFRSEHQISKNLRMVSIFIILLIAVILYYIYNKSIIENLNKNLSLEVKKQVNRNIEQLKIYQDEQLSNIKFAAMGQLAAGMTHEINTPLTYIKGNFEMLRYDIEDLPKSDIKERMSEDAIKITDGIQRISNIVESVREFSQKTEELKIEVNIYNTFISSLTILNNRSKQISNIKLNGENFKIGMKKDKYIFISNVQKQRIEQVWIIILNNALDELVKIDKFEKRLLDINIKLSKDKTYIIITIEDNAGGIPKDIIDNIFEPLVSNKTSNGMGIGLNIAKRIIDDQKGKILAYNKQEGAVFEIKLPCSKLVDR